MRKTFNYSFTLAVMVSLYSCNNNPEPLKTEGTDIELSHEELIDKGEYLVKSIGCDHCHTPKKMTDRGPVADSSKWMMGFENTVPLPNIDKSQIIPGNWVLFTGNLNAAVGPWGVSFAANLTPDATGIGNWTYENFRAAMVEGKYKGSGRPLLPPMPSFKDLKENDIKAIFEYLKSIKPIKNPVPAHIPFDQIDN